MSTKLIEEFTLFGLEIEMEHQTHNGANYTIFIPDDGRGTETIGTLDIHIPNLPDEYFSSTIVIRDSYKINFDLGEVRSRLFEVFGLPSDALWSLRFWRASEGLFDDNNPYALKRR